MSLQPSKGPGKHFIANCCSGEIKAAGTPCLPHLTDKGRHSSFQSARCIFSCCARCQCWGKSHVRENSLRGLRGPCQPGLLRGFHPALPSCLAVVRALQSCLEENIALVITALQQLVCLLTADRVRKPLKLRQRKKRVTKLRLLSCWCCF